MEAARDRPLVLFLEAVTARARTGYSLLQTLPGKFQPSDPDIPYIISFQPPSTWLATNYGKP